MYSYILRDTYYLDVIKWGHLHKDVRKNSLLLIVAIGEAIRVTHAM